MALTSTLTVLSHAVTTRPVITLFLLVNLSAMKTQKLLFILQLISVAI